MNNIIDFKEIYDEFIPYLADRGTLYNIYTMYIDNEAHLIIENDETKEIIYRGTYKCSKEEYLLNMNFILSRFSYKHTIRSLGFNELEYNDTKLLKSVLNSNNLTNILLDSEYNKKAKLTLSNSTINLTTYFIDKIDSKDLTEELYTKIYENISNHKSIVSPYEISNVNNPYTDTKLSQFLNLFKRLLHTYNDGNNYTINMFYSENNIHVLVKDKEDNTVLHIKEYEQREKSIGCFIELLIKFYKLYEQEINISYFTNITSLEKSLIDSTRKEGIIVNYENSSINEGNIPIRVFNIKSNNINVKYIMRHNYTKEINLMHSYILNSVSNRNIEQNKKLVK